MGDVGFLTLLFRGRCTSWNGEKACLRQQFPPLPSAAAVHRCNREEAPAEVPADERHLLREGDGERGSVADHHLRAQPKGDGKDSQGDARHGAAERSVGEVPQGGQRQQRDSRL